MGLEMDAGKRLSVKIDISSSKSGSYINEKLEDKLMDNTRSGSNELDEVTHRDTTENSSSSFGNTDSDDDNLGDEAISSFHGDAESAVDYHGYMFSPRKKRLTPHWKEFTRPVMWRCKWAELQVAKLEAQARKYERQLAKYNQPEHVPFSQLNLSNKLLSRKKRRKTETTTDLAAHMSNHNLFSYYERRKGNKRAVGKAKNRAAADESSLWAKAGEDDYPMEQILQKLMYLELRVREMKGRVGKVTAENSGELENLSPVMPNDSTLNETPLYNITPFPNIGGKTHVGSNSSAQYMNEPSADDASKDDGTRFGIKYSRKKSRPRVG